MRAFPPSYPNPTASPVISCLRLWVAGKIVGRIRNARACLRLRAGCEKLKKVISANPEAPLNIECLMDEKDVRGFIKRDEFEQISIPILERVKKPLEKALSEAGLTVESIYAVEVVGEGSSFKDIWKIRVQLMKPVTWPPLIWGVVCGAAAFGNFHWNLEDVAKSVVCMMMSGPCLTGYTQTLNDWYDREIDAINEPYRPIPSGAISENECLLVDSVQCLAAFRFLHLDMKRSLVRMMMTN